MQLPLGDRTELFMTRSEEYRKIYHAVLNAMDRAPLSRDEILYSVLEDFELTPREFADNSTNSRKNDLKSKAGNTINELLKKGTLERTPDGLYKRNLDKPIAIRMERCEEAILQFLREKPMSKSELRDRLTRLFRTDETASTKDDNQLSSYTGQILKRLVSDRILRYDGYKYSPYPAKTAELNNRQEIAALRAEFLSLLHSRGGEFFEQYFMNLLAKYLVRLGKTVTESRTTGGSDDGGIDGIAKTVDTLGFRETIMVQTKNRNDFSSETEVRGFYGAVCANQGTRGIFATSSDFYPSAHKFLDSIDNCVGVNGEKIFSMATDVSYGIKRVDGRLTIDRDII